MMNKATADLVGPEAWTETVAGGMRYVACEYHRIDDRLELTVHDTRRSVSINLTPHQWEQTVSCLNRALPEGRKLHINGTVSA